MKRIHSRTVLCFALALILGLSGLSGCRREDENRAEAENPHAMSVSLREGTAVGTSDVPAETDAPTEKADPEAEADAPVEADLPPETEAKTEDPPAPDMPAESPAKTAGTGKREIAVFGCILNAAGLAVMTRVSPAGIDTSKLFHPLIFGGILLVGELHRQRAADKNVHWAQLELHDDWSETEL